MSRPIEPPGERIDSTPTGRPFRHGGSGSGYKQGCRCDECRLAHRRRSARRRAERTALLAADPTLAQHGTASTYRNWGCRCDECRAAGVAAALDYQRRKREHTA